MNQVQLAEPKSDVFLHLQRPLIFFDLETTGVDPQHDRIIEISAIKLHPDQSQENLYYLLNPGIHIPEEASEVHGFTDEDVRNKPTFCNVASQVCRFFTNCDLAGFNVRRFDIPCLMEEFHRCKMYPILLTETKVVDVLSLYHKKEPRDLTSAVRFYCGEEFDKAHSAQADVEATIKVLQSQLRHYEDIIPNVDALHSFSFDHKSSIDFSGKFGRNKHGQITFTFGKHKNKVVDLDNREIQDYFTWLTEKGNPSVEMLMAAKRVKSQHKCHKMCTEWLESKGILSSPQNMAALQEAIRDEKDVYPFSVTPHGKKLSIVFCHSEEPVLILCSEDDRHTTLLLLQHHAHQAVY